MLVTQLTKLLSVSLLWSLDYSLHCKALTPNSTEKHCSKSYFYNLWFCERQRVIISELPNKLKGLSSYGNEPSLKVKTYCSLFIMIPHTPIVHLRAILFIFAGSIWLSEQCEVRHCMGHVGCCWVLPGDSKTVHIGQVRFKVVWICCCFSSSSPFLLNAVSMKFVYVFSAVFIL